MRNGANVELIRNMMKHKKIRGNVKDYSVLANNMLMDCSGTYTVKRTEFETPDKKGNGEVLLLHKKWLHRFIHEDDAALFWNRKLRMRVIRCRK